MIVQELERHLEVMKWDSVLASKYHRLPVVQLSNGVEYNELEMVG